MIRTMEVALVLIATLVVATYVLHRFDVKVRADLERMLDEEDRR